MLFVPLPLFASLCLGYALVRLLASRDMRLRANQLLAGLVTLYLLQSVLVTLRWGYGFAIAQVCAAYLAPLMPVVAFLAYRSLADGARNALLVPLLVVLVNWTALIFAPALADVMIPATYLVFGALIVFRARQDADVMALTRIDDAAMIRRLMMVIGLMLIAAAVVDGFILYDFALHGGASVGGLITFVQTAFILVVGLAAALVRPLDEEPDAEPDQPPAQAADPQNLADHQHVVDRLAALFATEGLHRQEDLSLRRLSRRLGLPDKRVSGAINRVHGMNVSQFVNSYRIKDACALLRETDQNVLHISLAVGFMSKSNFNREFLRIMGVSPSAWRETAQQNP